MENESTGQEHWSSFEFFEKLKGLQVEDPTRILQIVQVPAIYKPITWAEKMHYKLIAQAVQRQTLRNKWIVYPLAIFLTLLAISLICTLGLLLYKYTHAHGTSWFGILGAEVGIIVWMYSKEKLEKSFPLGDWETIRYKRKKHGRTKIYY